MRGSAGRIGLELTSSLLELEALNVGREEPADLELSAEAVIVGCIKVGGGMGAGVNSGVDRRVNV